MMVQEWTIALLLFVSVCLSSFDTGAYYVTLASRELTM